MASTDAAWARPAREAVASDVTIFESVAAARGAWRAVAGPASATPYQAYAFQAAWADEVAVPEGEKVRVAMLAGPDGRADLLLPITIHRRGPLGIARFLGGSHANFHMAPFRPEAAPRLDRARLERFLHETARALKIDAYALDAQPLAWEGVTNPLALLPYTAGANIVRSAPLPANAEDFLNERLGKNSRRTLRSKLRKLEETGPVVFRRAADPADRKRVLRAFFAQKADWFAARGIADGFAPIPLQRFYARLAAEDTALFDLYAMTVGGDMVATFGGVNDGHRFSCMLNSITLGCLTRYSPGEHLLHHVIADCAARGVKVFDLGAGDAYYKARLLETVEPHIDVVFGTSIPGKLWAAAYQAKLGLKRRVKASPQLMALASRLRTLGKGAPKDREVSLDA